MTKSKNLSLLEAARMAREALADDINGKALKDFLVFLDAAIAQAEADPAWVCLEGMDAEQLKAYDYGCALTLGAVKDILDGKDRGEGTCYPEWQAIRKRLLALVSAEKEQPGDWYFKRNGAVIAPKEQK